MTAPRLALVEDIAALRMGLPTLLDRVQVVAAYARVEDLLAERPDVDLVLLDLHLAVGDQPRVRQGLAAVRAVVGTGLPTCLYTQEERRFVLAACLAAGARGLVAKTERPEVVQDAVLRVLDGEVVMPASVVGLAAVLARRGRLTLLSERQQQLLSGRARGQTYAEIGRTLHLSEATLRGYWRDLSDLVAQYLSETAPGDIEVALGLAPGDLLEVWPEPGTDPGPRPAQPRWTRAEA